MHYGLYVLKKREKFLKGQQTTGRQVAIHSKQILLHIVNIISSKSIH